MPGLTHEQVVQLLRPINERRVSKRDGMSHLESYDVRAHLNRILGFGEWSGDVVDMTMLYEDEKTLKSGKPGYSVAYRCTYRLTIHATGATYTETAAGDGQMPDFKRADAHDFAIKTAESQALKRCAINLGDQFGISLYQQGSTMALVGKTLNMPTSVVPVLIAPVDEHVESVAPETPVSQAEPARPAAPAGRDLDSFRVRALEATTKPMLARLLLEATTAGVAGSTTTDADGTEVVLADLINARIKKVA